MVDVSKIWERGICAEVEAKEAMVERPRASEMRHHRHIHSSGARESCESCGAC